ncbi:AMP-binding protein [Maribacter flavus]|uniref:AMP-binding protein n=1 Tax=Maribacter flavus TaxID=1658664 RepID=A0A5B2TS40_9FLAO|nr:AMP-binding protein [Maribacter flavus]KAA2217352.1 AMP-binding protein [Maribacter flavus]
MTESLVHPNFKINGKAVSGDGLWEVAHRFIKEGHGYQESVGRFLLDWISPSAKIHVNTSGSTGKPKKIELLKNHMRNSALATGAFFNLKSGDTCLLCLSCDYIAGKMMLVRAMLLGLDIYIAEPTATPLQQIDHFQTFRFCAMVPLQVQASLDALERIETLIIGGASVSNALKKELLPKKTRCFETYGMTETITHVAMRELSEASKNPFRALPNVHFSLDDRECLVIDAPKIASNKIVTNDQVALVSDTEFLWLGRYDNVINSGGVKLFPEAIEEKLSTYLQDACIVAGIEDERLGQKLVLVMESDSTQKIDLDLFKEIKTLAPYERPKEIYYLPTFIRTKNGKIQRELTLQKAINNQ